MKVYDCFTFYNEFELLELRLKSLYDFVDYFVIVEADKTLNNKPKPFYFEENKNKFAEFLPKVRNLKIKINVSYKGTGDWAIEITQRNSISQGLQDAAPEDLIFISDVDEFWPPDILQKINNLQVPLLASYSPPPYDRRIVIPCQLMIHAADYLNYFPIVLEQRLHYYYLDWTTKSGMWQGTIITKYKNLTTPQDLRSLRFFLPHIPQSGWHFSWMGGAEKIIDKMNSIVDANEIDKKSNGKFSKRNHVEKVIKKGKDLFDRKGIPASELVHCDINSINLPNIQEFVKKYPYFLKQKD